MFACKLSMFLGTVNSAMLIKILTQPMPLSPQNTHYSPHLHTFIQCMLVTRIALCVLQMTCRVVVYFKLQTVKRMFQQETRIRNQHFDDELVRIQTIDNIRNDAIQALVQLPPSIWWKMNHKCGVISLIWLALGLALVFIFDSIIKVWRACIVFEGFLTGVVD
jgi:hypothetical protein